MQQCAVAGSSEDSYGLLFDDGVNCTVGDAPLLPSAKYAITT